MKTIDSSTKLKRGDLYWFPSDDIKPIDGYLCLKNEATNSKVYHTTRYSITDENVATRVYVTRCFITL